MKKETNSQILLLGIVAVFATTAGVFLRSLTSDGPGEISSEEQVSNPALSNRKPMSRPVKRIQFQVTLEREQLFETMDPSEFPALMEDELRTAKSSDSIFEISRRWAKSDPEGYLVWLRKQPPIFMMREHGFNMGLVEALIGEIEKEDPKRAWNLADELQTYSNHTRMRILTGLFESDPALAKEIVQENLVDFSMDDNGLKGFEPMKELPILNQLLPGPETQTIVTSTIFHWSDQSRRPGGVAESKKWFDQLNPKLQSQVLRTAERLRGRSTPFGSPDKILKAWTTD